MANAKTRTEGRVGSQRNARHAKATFTTALMTDAGEALPKGIPAFTFHAPAGAAKILQGKPGKLRPLMQGYGEAFAKSREAGHAVSFRVDVDPSGGATITPIEQQVASEEKLQVEEIGEPSPELRRALEAARERGRLRAAEILSGEDMLSADDFAQLLGTTRMTVNTKRQNGLLLGLDGAKRGFRFPTWQLNGEGRPYPDLAVLQEHLGGAWALYRFLVQPHGELDGLTGREALERGRSKAVLEAAEGIARGDFG